jgi:hypothetical protein
MAHDSGAAAETTMADARKFFVHTLAAAVLGVTLAPAALSATQQYSTDFNYTQNPLSDGGRWAQHVSNWTVVRTNGSIAYGTQTQFNSYDDSLALLTGFSPNQRLSAVVSFTGTRTASTSSHEVELILRGTINATSLSLYEVNLGYSGTVGWYMQIFKLIGPLGTFVEIDSSGLEIPPVKTGDVFTAEIEGSQIRAYLNGVLYRTATDGSITTGQPGIGFFWRGTENASDLGYDSFTALGSDAALTAPPNPPTNLTVR